MPDIPDTENDRLVWRMKVLGKENITYVPTPAIQKNSDTIKFYWLTQNNNNQYQDTTMAQQKSNKHCQDKSTHNQYTN